MFSYSLLSWKQFLLLALTFMTLLTLLIEARYSVKSPSTGGCLMFCRSIMEGRLLLLLYFFRWHMIWFVLVLITFTWLSLCLLGHFIRKYLFFLLSYTSYVFCGDFNIMEIFHCSSKFQCTHLVTSNGLYTLCCKLLLSLSDVTGMLSVIQVSPLGLPGHPSGVSLQIHECM